MVDSVIIIDCGAQYGPLIARHIRNLKVYSEIVPAGVSPHYANTAKGIVISGGPSSVYINNSPRPDATVLDMGIPVLGICYGHQWIAHASGGRVEPGNKEFGHARLIVQKGDLLKGLGQEEDVWMSHGDSVLSLPEGFEIYASTEKCPIAAYGNMERSLYGVQFHPEVAHTANGKKIFENFLFGICGCEPNWKMDDYASRAIEGIKTAIGSERAVIALSGGIDSATVAALGARAIGNKLSAVYVDTGLMRQEETEEIERLFGDGYEIDLTILREKDRFYKALKGISNSEKKRNIIGDLFADILDENLSKNMARYLLQGTIYPDVIESAAASKKASRIKTHHNVGSPRIQAMRESGRVIEPLRYLFKDEVREIAESIGMPLEIVWRQPFPGPGLAVRIEGAVTPKKVETVRASDRIVKEEIERIYPLRERPWQYFAILANSRRTGVKGDERTYGNVIVVRAVESREAMTSNASRLDWDTLNRIASRITNEVPEITGVAYEITSKPPATIEWE